MPILFEDEFELPLDSSRWLVADSQRRLRTDGGVLGFSPSDPATWTQPAIVGQSGIARVEGRVLEVELSLRAPGQLVIGFQNGKTPATAQTAHAFFFDVTGVLNRREGGKDLGIGQWTPNTTYRLRLELSAPGGARYAVQGGGYAPLGGAEWTTLSTSSTGAAAELYPALLVRDALGTLAFVRIREAGTVPASTEPVKVVDIAPATVENGRRVQLTLSGTGFVAGMEVTIGYARLTDVVVQSPTTATATLPAGVCPGDYQATVSGPGGRRATGGKLFICGIRSASVGGQLLGAPIALTGTSQRLVVPLPTVEITDTTCGADSSPLELTVTMLFDGRPSGTLTPRLVMLRLPNSSETISAPLERLPTGGKARVLVPRFASGTLLSASVEVDVPASARSGRYVAALTADSGGRQ